MSSVRTMIEQAQRVGRVPIGVGVIALMLAVVLGVFNTRAFFGGYLVGYVLWFGVAFGSLMILMIHRLTGGHWGNVLRVPLVAAVATFPLLALLFIPLLFGMTWLYPWTNPQIVAADHHLTHKTPYLNLPFFMLRLALIFAVWIALAALMTRWLWLEEIQPDVRRRARLTQLSAGGLVALVLTGSVAAIDWIMSLEPLWYSTIFGVYIMSGFALTAMAFLIIVRARLTAMGWPPLERPRLHDLGNLLFMFVAFYAYIAFSQFLIIWSGNLPEEVGWYVRRTAGVWWWVPGVLIVVHFALPLAVLLSRQVKRAQPWLAMVAALVLAMRVVDVVWLILPSFEPLIEASMGVTTTGVWEIVAALLGIAAVGGLWLAAFVGVLMSWVKPMHSAPSAAVGGVG